MKPVRSAAAKMQKKILGLLAKTDYLLTTESTKFNWRHTDGLERGSARRWVQMRRMPEIYMM